MTGLLDTHTLLWWLAGDERLSPAAKSFIATETNTILVSAVSAWEIATKFRIGKLPGVQTVVQDIEACIVQQGFTGLAISLAHAQRAGLLPEPHRDPFDRMLIAQALILNIPLISNEVVFDSYGVIRVW
jgi:PIN domain nuclease of toxin-antitoxin system